MVNFHDAEVLVSREEALRLIDLETIGKVLFTPTFIVTPAEDHKCIAAFTNSCGAFIVLKGTPEWIRDKLFINTEESIKWRLENECI